LGLDWDGPVLLQSQRLPRLKQALSTLIDTDLAYACVCSRAEIRAAESAPQQGAIETRYPGTCRGRFESADAARRATGREVGYRFQVAAGPVLVQDGVSGEHEFDVSASVGDFMIGRRDGTPAYQLAVVIDDADQQVTEVVRGDDLLASAARQMLLQRALSLPTPRYFHLPLVVDSEGRRLAKRHQDLSLAELRALHVDPRAIVAWVARSAQIACDARPTAAECISLFSMDRLPRSRVSVPHSLPKFLAT
jgi:glutamyl-tRNA synthetase